MNLDKCINIQLVTLSDKYDISLTHIKKVDEGRIKQSFLVSYNVKVKEDEVKHYKKEWFSNKQDLVSWLVCLE